MILSFAPRESITGFRLAYERFQAIARAEALEAELDRMLDAYIRPAPMSEGFFLIALPDGKELAACGREAARQLLRERLSG